ncbi:MAG TPA: hypothetical protein DD400_03915, partial [Rhodospirillaceae bacterium]|nr:hypothetical protein [Rhodospirillaceae bacterium]
QKEITHNEALNDLDILVQPVVASRTISTPPASPSDGDVYIVGGSATDAWSGREDDLAFYFSGWRFKTPEAGWQVYVTAESAFALFDGSSWSMRTIDASVSWDPASIATGSGLSSSTITATGAAFGDFVSVSAPYDLQGLVATAYVSAAGSVVIRLHNATGSAVDLASGTWNVRVIKG